MPGVYEQGGLGPILRQLAQRLRALETQQQSVTTDNLGRPIKTTGLVPGSNPPLYGDMYWDPITGAKKMFQGYDSGSDTAYTAWYDASGHVTTKVDATGFHFYDPSGTEEVRVGQLNASPQIYGLGVLPYGGSELQQVGGFIGITPTGVTGATNTAYTAFGGTSTITAEIGPSTTALVSVHADIATGGSNVQGNVGVQLDGGTWYDFYLMSCSATSGAQVFAGNSNFWTGISPGSHTFTLGYKTANGAVTFNDPLLIVQPL